MFIAPLLVAAPFLSALPTQEGASVTDLLLVVTKGGESLFADPKDQALLRALQLMDDRLAELPGEVPDFPRELAMVMPWVSRLAGGPMTLRVGMWEGADPMMGPPIFAQLTLPEGSSEGAQARATQLTEHLMAAGMPEPQVDEAGRVIIPAPMPVWYGVEGDSLKLTVGQADEGELVPGDTGLPAGVDPLVAVSLEYGQLMRFVGDMAAMSGDPSAVETFDMLDSMGLLDMSLQMAYGIDDQLGYTVLSMPGYAGKMREMGLAVERTLTAADLARVPADAVWATVSGINPGGTMDYYMGMLEDMLAQQGMSGDPMEMVAAQLGFHPRTDLIDHLGEVVGMYSSDTTGGGSFLSMVLFMELADGEALEATLDRLKGMVNAIAGMQAMGYVRVQDWEEAGISYTSLVFPGLPVPLELTYAIDGGYLYAGMTPQSVMAAVTHARVANGGLLANQRFTANLSGGMEGLVSVSFLDTPRVLADGYGAMVLLGSALRNATRSPQDESRDPGLVVPSYPVLVAGAKATVTASRYIGDDVVAESRGDRSMVVGLTGAMGAVSSSPILPLALAVGLGAGVAEYQEQQRAMEWMYEEDAGDWDDEEYDWEDESEEYDWESEDKDR